MALSGAASPLHVGLAPLLVGYLHIAGLSVCTCVVATNEEIARFGLLEVGRVVSILVEHVRTHHCLLLSMLSVDALAATVEHGVPGFGRTLRLGLLGRPARVNSTHFVPNFISLINTDISEGLVHGLALTLFLLPGRAFRLEAPLDVARPVPLFLLFTKGEASGEIGRGNSIVEILSCLGCLIGHILDDAPAVIEAKAEIMFSQHRRHIVVICTVVLSNDGHFPPRVRPKLVITSHPHMRYPLL